MAKAGGGTATGVCPTATDGVAVLRGELEQFLVNFQVPFRQGDGVIAFPDEGGVADGSGIGLG